MYIINVMGAGDQIIFSLISEHPVNISDTDTNGELNLLVGDKEFTLLLGQFVLRESDNSIAAPSWEKSKT